MGCVMQEKKMKLFSTIFSALVLSMMCFVTIGTGTATVMFASAQQQQPTNATTGTTTTAAY
jgi:hypothetical protein